MPSSQHLFDFSIMTGAFIAICAFMIWKFPPRPQNGGGGNGPQVEEPIVRLRHVFDFTSSSSSEESVFTDEEGTSSPGEEPPDAHEEPSADDDGDGEEEPQDSSDDDLLDDEGGPHIPEDEGGQIFADQEDDSYDSEVVPDQGSDASGGGDGVRKQRGRKIPIPNEPPRLVRSGGESESAGEASGGEEVEQEITNQESLIRPLLEEAAPEEDETERSGNSWPFKTEAARRGEKWGFPSDGADDPFLVQNWKLKLPEVQMVNPIHSPTTEHQGDRNEGDDDSLEIYKILNPDPQPSLDHTSSLPTPSDFTGGNRAAAGEDSPKTEQEGDRNQVGQFQNINPQPPLSGTLRRPPQSGFIGGSSIPAGGDDLPEADQERDTTEHGDNSQEMATIQHSNPLPPLSATLPAPPPADYTGGSSAGARLAGSRTGNGWEQ